MGSDLVWAFRSAVCSRYAFVEEHENSVNIPLFCMEHQARLAEFRRKQILDYVSDVNVGRPSYLNCTSKLLRPFAKIHIIFPWTSFARIVLCVPFEHSLALFGACGTCIVNLSSVQYCEPTQWTGQKYLFVLYSSCFLLKLKSTNGCWRKQVQICLV